MSVLTLTCISIDRWYAICKPLEFSSTKSRAKITIALIWLVSMLIGSPNVIFLVTKPLYEEEGYTYTDCTYAWPEESSKIYQLCIVVLLFVCPIVLMSVSYAQIVNVLWRNSPMEQSFLQSAEALEAEQLHIEDSRRKYESRSLEAAAVRAAAEAAEAAQMEPLQSNSPQANNTDQAQPAAAAAHQRGPPVSPAGQSVGLLVGPGSGRQNGSCHEHGAQAQLDSSSSPPPPPPPPPPGQCSCRAELAATSGACKPARRARPIRVGAGDEPQARPGKPRARLEPERIFVLLRPERWQRQRRRRRLTSGQEGQQDGLAALADGGARRSRRAPNDRAAGLAGADCKSNHLKPLVVRADPNASEWPSDRRRPPEELAVNLGLQLGNFARELRSARRASNHCEADYAAGRRARQAGAPRIVVVGEPERARGPKRRPERPIKSQPDRLAAAPSSPLGWPTVASEGSGQEGERVELAPACLRGGRANYANRRLKCDKCSRTAPGRVELDERAKEERAAEGETLGPVRPSDRSPNPAGQVKLIHTTGGRGGRGPSGEPELERPKSKSWEAKNGQANLFHSYQFSSGQLVALALGSASPPPPCASQSIDCSCCRRPRRPRPLGRLGRLGGRLRRRGPSRQCPGEPAAAVGAPDGRPAAHRAKREASSEQQRRRRRRRRMDEKKRRPSERWPCNKTADQLAACSVSPPSRPGRQSANSGSEAGRTSMDHNGEASINASGLRAQPSAETTATVATAAAAKDNDFRQWAEGGGGGGQVASGAQAASAQPVARTACRSLEEPRGRPPGGLGPSRPSCASLAATSGQLLLALRCCSRNGGGDGAAGSLGGVSPTSCQECDRCPGVLRALENGQQACGGGASVGANKCPPCQRATTSTGLEANSEESRGQARRQRAQSSLSQPALHTSGSNNNNNHHHHHNHHHAAGSSATNPNARFCKLIESRKKAAKMLIMVVIMFGLCYLPVHFLNTLR